jgi:starch phosphorylase
VHNSLPNYSGGLGILAGDHLKSASDLNVPLVAVGLALSLRLFSPENRHDGWQEERYLDSFSNPNSQSPVLKTKTASDFRFCSYSRSRSFRAAVARANRQNFALFARHESAAKHRS